MGGYTPHQTDPPLTFGWQEICKKKLVRHVIGVVVDHKIHCVGRKLEFPSMKRDTPMLDSKPSVEDRFQPDDYALNLFVYQ